jgi:hypothetical protein
MMKRGGRKSQRELLPSEQQSTTHSFYSEAVPVLVEDK